ncbi:MAG: restriction endonuclease subunit S, partial [Verrucomicrobiota bacterium]
RIRRLFSCDQRTRLSVIALTKGLNPNAPMKDSGIEWLGEVPEHWVIRKMTHLFRAFKGRNSQMLTKEYLSENAGDYPVYSGQTENNGVMGGWSEYEFDAGDEGVLFSTTVGAKAMTLNHLRGKFSLSQNCMIIKPVKVAGFVRFFYYHLQPLFAFERSLIPDHMQASFRMEDLYGYQVAVPGENEQAAIALAIDSYTQASDSLASEAVRAITLLQERRSALISAAVTGQIDVRGFSAGGGSEAA